jgi:hypothetical protein
MMKLLILIACAILMSCSSLEDVTSREANSPGYQFGRPMDEKALETSFLEKNR